MNKSPTILIIGSAGQLGKSFQSIQDKYLNFKFFFANRQQLDLAEEESIENFFKNKKFEIIINCGAYTSVDKAEKEEELANKINHLALNLLSNIAKEHNSKLIHISTDYVFSGKKCNPYTENDEVGPQGVYGKTKLLGEEAIFKILKKNAVIIRTSWLYSEFGNNFLKTMLKLGQDLDCLRVVFDQTGTPTYAKDLAIAIMSIIQSEAFNNVNLETNIFHFSNEGVSSWYDFVKSIFEIKGIECEVIPIETKEYPTPAIRPSYSVLNKKKIKQFFNINISHWNDGLKDCIIALNNRAL